MITVLKTIEEFSSKTQGAEPGSLDCGECKRFSRRILQNMKRHGYIEQPTRVDLY
jgi:hypothetical protein